MTRPPASRALALLFMLALVAPAALTLAPQRAQAIPVTKVADTAPTTFKNLAENTITAIKTAASYVEDVTNTAANYAKYIKSYVLDPIAFLTSGNLLKKITSSILGFVGGKNSSGKPLYVLDARAYLQNVGDVEAYSFLKQFQSNSNSPFAGAITSSLRAKYLQDTSLAGFFAGNKSTLNKTNTRDFVQGKYWNPATWFSLTTQDQNNPYTLYYLAQDQLARQVGTEQGAKLAQANWGQGILSWCGGAINVSTGSSGSGSSSGSSGSSSSSGASSDLYGGPNDFSGGGTVSLGGQSGQNNGALTASAYSGLAAADAQGLSNYLNSSAGKTASDALSTPGGSATIVSNTDLTTGQTTYSTSGTGGSSSGSYSSASTYYDANGNILNSSTSVNPGDPCVRSDGTSGVITTPGSIIKAYLTKALGSGIDKLAGVGDISASISKISSNIGTIFSTFNLATSLFGGSSSGLLGFSGGAYSSPFADYLNSDSYFGLKTSDVVTSANSTSGALGVDSLSTRTDDYEAAWKTIKSAADGAKTALDSLKSSCSSQASAASTALVTVNGVLDDAATASSTIASARALIKRVADEATSGSDAYATDLALELTTAPSASDVTTAQEDATQPGIAYASPTGSLTVYGGSTVDRMTLIQTNAGALASSCP